MKHQRTAFTLVEMAIVLVIIGLLVGGVLGGKSMMRAAEVRTVVTDYQKYNSAYLNFKKTYNAMPGDMSDATDFWGKNNTLCSGTVGQATVPGTCNGNSSGYFDAGLREHWLAWQHLALAKMIDGTYAGLTAGSGAAPTPGVDLPLGKMKNTAWSFVTLNPYTSAFVGAYTDVASVDHNYLVLGTGNGTGAMGYTGLFLTPKEAQSIDAKIDDGYPGRGVVTVGRNNTAAGQCGTTTAAATSEYAMTNKLPACPIAFLLK